MQKRDLASIAQEEVDDVLAGLPRHVREAVELLAIRLEHLPDPDSGLEPDILGVFLGNTHTELTSSGAEAMPTEIVLFLENLWDFAEEDEEVFREEVRITFLHELGHFLDLDEDDLDERGLG